MGRIAIPAAILLSISACNAEPPPPATSAEDAAPAADAGPAVPEGAMSESSPEPATAAGDWVVLFNGENLDGWRGYNAESPGEEWKIEDGVLVLDVPDDTEEMTAGDLITEQQYENFELELEWKVSEGGNSGIFYRVREIPGHEVAYETGIEMQVLDDTRHPDGGSPETSAGACYGLYGVTDKTLRPVGEWNAVRLVVNEGQVEHWLNGEKILDYTIGSDDWNERIANSKFAGWEHFAKYPRGHVGLQDHTDRVWFRNIRIREL